MTIPLVGTGLASMVLKKSMGKELLEWVQAIVIAVVLAQMLNPIVYNAVAATEIDEKIEQIKQQAEAEAESMNFDIRKSKDGDFTRLEVIEVC